MSIRNSICLAALPLIFATVANSRQPEDRDRDLSPVYRNEHFQLTGISMSKTGRLFVNFPRWSDRYLNAVIEVMPDGSSKPFPDVAWNRWDLKPADADRHFVCVQSVVVDANDALWVLDPAAPLLASPVPNGPKLVKIDLATNTVVQTIRFGPDIALPDSYLNDIRFDNERGFAYITDSGHGGLVVLDLNSGESRRVLDGNPSTLAEPGVQIIIDGKPVIGPTGKPPQFNADSIALSPDLQYVYYKPLTGVNLWRIKTEVLRNESATEAQVAAAVEHVAKIFPTDGLWMDAEFRLYLSDIQNNAVKRLLPNGKIENVACSRRLQWPDTFTQGPDGAIYISASEINLSPPYNKGYRVGRLPFEVFRVDR